MVSEAQRQDYRAVLALVADIQQKPHRKRLANYRDHAIIYYWLSRSQVLQKTKHHHLSLVHLPEEMSVKINLE